MIPNPYIVGNPIEDSRMFFGREDDFGYIRTKVAGAGKGGMVVLCGTRRSGKTSILFQILRGRLGDTFLPVLVDLQSINVDGDAAFVTMLAQKVAAAAGEPRLADELAAGTGDFAAMRAPFVRLCGRARGPRAGLVLMFDEYELFEDAIDAGRMSTRSLDLLGELIRSGEGIYVVFAGSTRIEERRADYWAACLGPSLHRRISFLSPNDAMRLIREPVAGLVEYDPGIPELILGLGAGQPFYTQVTCQTLVDRLNDGGSTRATAGDVEAVVQEIIENPLPHMIFTWSSLNDVEKFTLAVLADLEKDDPRPRTAGEILHHLAAERAGISLAAERLNEALAHLFSEDLLLKDEDGERFCFRIGLWQRWVSRMHSVWQVLDEVQAEGRAPQQGVIRLARRRAQRLLAGTAVLATGVALWFAVNLVDQGVVQPPAPDSTWISFTSEPTGARFFLDDRLLGTAPRDSVRVPAGRLAYRWEHEGFRSESDSITLAPDTLTDFSETLAELTGDLRVETRPAGARILVDEQPWPHATPATISALTVRTLHGVRVEHPGYLPAQFTNVRIVTDSLVTLSHEFRRPSHSLTVATVPAGAAIEFDGVPRGESPLSLSSVAEGEHRLACRLAGYAACDTLINLPLPGGRAVVRMTPLPPGMLQARVQPYADIYLDGVRLATAEVARDTVLAVGRYQVEFRHPHFAPFTAEIEIASGDTVTVAHRFGGGG